MSQESLLALIGFAFVMSISPGPGNFLLLSSGASFGFSRSLPLILGISFGFLSMVFAVGIGLGQVFDRFPFLLAGLKLVCAVYVVFLAWKIARIRSLDAGTTDQLQTPIGFVQASLFQLVNPKAWAVALILAVSYTDPEHYLISLVSLIAVFALINIPTISTWALSGAALRRFLTRGNRLRIFNIMMAILLIGTMLPVLLGLAPL